MQEVSDARTGGVVGSAEQILDDVLAETEEAAPLNPLLAAKMKAAAVRFEAACLSVCLLSHICVLAGCEVVGAAAVQEGRRRRRCG